MIPQGSGKAGDGRIPIACRILSKLPKVKSRTRPRQALPRNSLTAHHRPFAGCKSRILSRRTEPQADRSLSCPVDPICIRQLFSWIAISAKGRNGTAELLEIVADSDDDRIPGAARFSLEVLARQYTSVTAEIGTIEKRILAWHRSCQDCRGSRKSLAWARSSPPSWSPRWVIGRHSRQAAISRPGSGRCPDSIQLAARRGSAGYQNRAIDICDGCSLLKLWLSSDMHGSTAWKELQIKTKHYFLLATQDRSCKRCRANKYWWPAMRRAIRHSGNLARSRRGLA
jgi:hypothetical protein